ncbi:LOW QUALITY PROTEIN: GTP:AMP phosphotransferase AK3, mitochondrial, partial [Galemys pyrenaicus]
ELQAEVLERVYPIHLVMKLNVHTHVITQPYSSCTHCASSLDFNTPKAVGMDDLTRELCRDDQPETLIKRLKIFKDQTKLILAYYQNKGSGNVLEQKQTRCTGPYIHAFLQVSQIHWR